MANVYATKTGNWSDTTVWNTGALPQTTDDVYSNTYTVTIDQNVQVLSIRNTAASGITAGGGFACSTARTVNCSAGVGFLAFNATLLEMTGSATITTLGVGTTSGTGTVFRANGSGLTWNHTGDLVASGGSSAYVAVQANTSVHTVNITGNITATSGYGFTVNSNGVWTITGNLVGSGGSAFYLNGGLSTVTVNVTGAVTVISSTAWRMDSNNGANLIANITGPITAVGSTPAISSLSQAGLVFRVTGPFYCGASGGFPWTMINPVKLVPIAGNEIRFAAHPSGTSSLYSSDMTTGPAVTDVRSGVAYSYNSTPKTGTLAVPSPAYVSLGVATDNTVGTLVAPTPGEIADAVLDELISGHTVEGSLGKDLNLLKKLLRNKVITDPSTGGMTVYDDNGTDVLFTANVYKDTAGSVQYNGTGANRRDRLT